LPTLAWLYVYAYRKDGKTLQKRYIGKTIGDLLVRKVAKKVDTTPSSIAALIMFVSMGKVIILHPLHSKV
jgi:hypothetical protein